MSKLDQDDFRKLAGIIREAYDQTLKGLVQKEIEDRVRCAANNLLYTVVGEELRSMVRKEVQKHVNVEVVVKLI